MYDPPPVPDYEPEILSAEMYGCINDVRPIVLLEVVK
jgi:hypothetical protein